MTEISRRYYDVLDVIPIILLVFVLFIKSTSLAEGFLNGDKLSIVKDSLLSSVTDCIKKKYTSIGESKTINCYKNLIAKY